MNSARPLLAEALGLRMPSTLKEERVMWETVVRFVRGIHTAEDIQVLDRHRGFAAARAPSDTASTATFLIVDDDETSWFELILGDGELVARGPDRASRALALSDIAYVREVAPIAPVIERDLAAKHEQTG